MKAIKNTIKIMVLSLLIVVSGGITDDLSAQNRNKGRSQQRVNECLDIPNLTDTQKTKITTLQDAHRISIDALRDKRRDTRSTSEKDVIRTEMDNKIKTHKSDIRKTLNKEQQIYFDQNCTDNKSFNRGNKGRRSGNGNRANNESRGRSNR